jgi:hypothetical protein
MEWLVNMFTLQQKTDRKFHVLNQEGDIIGSVNVADSKEASELIRQWGGPRQVQQSKPKSAVQTLTDAFRARHMSPKNRQTFVLRGC